MKKIFWVFVIISALLIILLIGFKDSGDTLVIGGTKNNSKLSVILVGFGNKDQNGNWIGEAAPYMEKLNDATDVSVDLPMCDSAFEGNLFGSKVLIAISGMAKVKTAACMTEILENYDIKVKEVILAGIAGITPQRYKTANALGEFENSEPTMIGDICINYVAYDFDLQYYSSDQKGTTLPDPKFWTIDDAFSAGYIRGDQNLARELEYASREIVFPSVSKEIADINTLYGNTTRSPRIWSMQECMEATGDLYWNDTRADKKARELAAGYLSRIYNINLTANDIVIFTSMEAASVGSVIEKWNDERGMGVAFAYVRGASNFDQPNLDINGLPQTNGLESIKKFSQSGVSDYAIKNSSLVVLKMFEIRYK